MSNHGFREIQGLRFNLNPFRGYQFYTTSPNVEWAYWQNQDYDFCPGGSMIFAATPNFPRDPLGYQVSFTKDELNAIKLYAHPTHTLVENPPRKTINKGLVNEELVDECPYTPMPTTVGGVGGLNQIMNQVGTFKATNAWQVNGIPEEPCYYVIPKYTLIVNGNEQESVFTGHYKPDFSILTAWQQPGGQIFSYGMYSLVYYTTIIDVGYDMAPQKILPVMTGQMPDGDWPERACITRAGNLEFGYRWYVILHTANDDWLCWPYLTADYLDSSIVIDAPTSWKEQAYKSNVPVEYAKKARPLFPAWVYSTGDERRNHTEPLKPKPEPRITFHFNSVGTRAIGAMVERIPIDQVSEEFFRRINFVNPESGLSRNTRSWYSDFIVWPFDPINNLLYYAPVEELTNVPIKIDASKRFYGTSNEPGPQLLQYDRTGIIELEFIIDVIGPNLGDFTFSINILRNESPDVLDEYDVGTLIDVGYAKSMLSAPTVDNISVPGLNRDAEVQDAPLVDEIVTAFMTLYQHQDQKKLDLANYMCTNDTPSKCKVSFYKKDDYRTASNAILELPLLQKHGFGYSGNPLLDPDTGIPIGLPAEPHEFVDFPHNSFLEKYRSPNDSRPPKYVYSAKISNLDISTLSFYYIARINKIVMDNDSYNLESIPEDLFFIDSEKKIHKEFNEQSELCNVYVLGKIAYEHIAGIPATKEYLRGWADKAIPDFPNVDEEKIKTTYKNDFATVDWYYAEVAPLSGTVIWWLTGACGFCIYKTIEDSIYNRGWQHTREQPFPYKNIGVKYFTSGGSVINPPQPGDLITEEEAKDFLRYAIENWGEFIAGNLTCLVQLDDDRIVSVPYFFVEETAYDLCYGNINPFILAKEDFDKETFIERNAWFMMKLCNLITGIASDRIGDPYIGDAYNTQLCKFVLTLLSRELRFTFWDPFYFNLDGQLNLNTDYNYIKNYDWGVHLYNHYRTRHFSTDSNTTEYGNILVTPQGHYSFYYKDHYAINEKYTALGVYFVHGIQHSTEMLYPTTTPNTGFLLDTRVGNDELIYSGSFDWHLVDGVGWYFGLIKTSHLDLYNMAFSEDWRILKRDQGRSNPYALYSELPIRTKYIENQFKPEFTILLSVSPIKGEPLYRPHKSADDYYYTLQLEKSFPYNNYLVSPWDFPGYYYFDSRPYKQHIRLSPLFF